MQLDKYLLVAYVVRVDGGWFLHSHQTKDLQQVVLHDVAYDAELVKVAATPLRSERLLERDLHRRYTLPVPGWAEDPVPKSADNL